MDWYGSAVPSLVFDTSSEALVVLLASGPLVMAEQVAHGRRAQELLDIVEQLLADVGRNRSDIDRIVVGLGPGGFTGLRVGVTSARGLAAALQVPIAGVPTLAAIAWPLLHGDAVTDTDGRPVSVWASADAKRGESFVQEWSLDAGGTIMPVRDVVVLPNADVAGLVADAPLVEGPATPAGLAGIADVSLDAPLATIVPVYGRTPDAVPSDWSRVGR